MDVSEDRTNRSVCEYATYLSSARPVQIFHWAELVFDIVAFGSLTIFIRTNNFLKLVRLADTNMKILGLIGMFFYYVAILFSFGLHIYFKVRVYSTNNNYCGQVWNPITCIVFRLPVYFCFVFLGFFHLSLFIERARATFGKKEPQGAMLGSLLGILTTLVSFGVTMIPMNSDNFKDPRPYCFPHSSMKPVMVIIGMGITVLVSVIVTIGDTFIYFYSKKSLNNKNFNNYTLFNSFRLRETQLSMEIILPYSFIHSALFFIYVFSVIASNFFSTVSSLDDTAVIMQFIGITRSVYLAGVPMFLLIFVGWKKKDNWLVKQTKVTPETYFNQLNKQLAPRRTPQ